MKTKAQAANYAMAFMLAVTVIILGLAFAFPLNEVTMNAMNNNTGDGTDGMNCSSTLDDFTKAGCLVTDISQSFFIGGILALAGIIIAARIIFA